MAIVRLEIGFTGGAMLRVGVDDAQVEPLVALLTGRDGDDWCRIEAAEGIQWVDRDEIVSIRIPPARGAMRGGGGGS